MARSPAKRLRRSFRIGRDFMLHGLGLRTPPRRRFVLLSQPRSGSSALVSLLDGVPGVRCDGEIFHDRVPLPERYFDARSAAKPCHIYGCKILSSQIRDVQRFDRPEDFIRRLHSRGVAIFYLRRNNSVHAAISLLRARRYGFHRRRGQHPCGASPTHRLIVDCEELLAVLQQIEALARYEQRLLDGVEFLSLDYEGDLQHETQHQTTLDRICAVLGVRSAPARCDFLKVSPPAVRESVANYAEVAARLASTRWSLQLDERPED